MQAESGPTAILLTLVFVFALLVGLYFYERYSKEKVKRQIAAYRAEEARDAALAATVPEREVEPTPPATAKSVKLDKLTNADPGFSATEFLAIARETFLLVNEAKLRGAPVIARDLMVTNLEAQLPTQPTPMPSLELGGATINQFKMSTDEALLTVHFEVIGHELQDGQPSDLADPKRWSEDWDFVRSAKASTAPDDPSSLLPGWMVSHKGWRVSAIRTGEQSG